MDGDACLAHAGEHAVEGEEAEGDVGDGAIRGDPHDDALPRVDAAVGAVVQVPHGEQLVVCAARTRW